MHMMRTHQLLSYWKSMSAEERQGFLEFRICDLEVHFGKVEDGLAENIFSEAIGFAKKHKTWNFWPCCFCDEKFNDSELRMQHFDQKHNKSKLRYVNPQEVDANWVSMLVNGTWKPVDTREARKIIEEQSNSPSADLVSDSNVKWPLSDNVEREKILHSIYDEFRVLLRNNCLSKSNLEKVIKDSMDELHKQQLHIHGLDQIPLCICFLEVPQLEKILKFLHVVSNLCGLNKNPDMDSSLDDELDDYDIEEIEIKEMIAFNGDSLRLLMDEHLLQGELKCRDAVSGDGSAATCTIRADEVDVLPDSDALVSWLTVPSIGEALKSWTNIQNTKKHQLLKVIQRLEREFDIIETWRRQKSELENQKEALLAIESICIEELEKRKLVEMHIPQSYASLLSKRQKELDGADNGAMSQSSRFELDAISSILTEVQNVDHSQFEALLTSISSLSSDSVDQEDACITDAIHRRIDEEPSTETVAGVKFTEASTHDYQFIILPSSHSCGFDFLCSIILCNVAIMYVLHALYKFSLILIALQVTQGDELYVPQEETEEQFNLGFRPLSSSGHFPVSYDGDYPSYENVVAARADELGLHEEELKHEIEHDYDNEFIFQPFSICASPHLRTFRGKFLRRSTPAHVHIKDPCIVCELHGIFTTLREAKEGDDVVSPTTLRIALSKWQDCNFQEKNDASEALVAILDVLHWSFTFDSDSKLLGSSYTDSRNCDSDACIAHTHDHPKSPFDELLKCDIREKHQNSCDGCRKPNIPQCILSTPPHVFTIVLCWESVEVPAHKISATLGALSTKIDIGVIHEGLDPGNTHYLISIVCYGLEHYICFVYNRAKENWILYDDDKVKVISSWDGVLPMCSRELLQPQILFFEVNGSVLVTPLEETKGPDNPWEGRKAGRKRSGNHGKAKQGKQPLLKLGSPISF
ncbi:Inactive ubiquitin carboxyl-terminal hydrolase 53 [Camellia lanceoleosa]|nr:Inactive ubiquitin carboxyl-terminal hydrolase 53 [Camellia lanceoleosa]